MGFTVLACLTKSISLDSLCKTFLINNFKKITHVAQCFVVCALLTELPHISHFTVEK